MELSIANLYWKMRGLYAKRVYLTGMSMGGNGTFYNAYFHSEKYAAIVPVCGYFEDPSITNLSSLKDMPVWLFHSKGDEVIDWQQSQLLYDKLIAVGNSDVHITYVEEAAHDITKPAYDRAELWQWLMSK